MLKFSTHATTYSQLLDQLAVDNVPAKFGVLTSSTGYMLRPGITFGRCNRRVSHSIVLKHRITSGKRVYGLLMCSRNLGAWQD